MSMMMAMMLRGRLYGADGRELEGAPDEGWDQLFNCVDPAP
jgi:hypothetical protein